MQYLFCNNRRFTFSGFVRYLRYPVILLVLFSGLSACTQEQQNKLSRSLQNWTGTDGVLEIYTGDTLVRRFLKIDKLTTATATSGSEMRMYRYGYGFFDENLNMAVDPGEKKVYFEVSNYSTYIFFENPNP